MLELGDLNYLAIIIAAIAKFLVGGSWFSKLLFGRLWLKVTALKPEEMGNPRNAMMIGFGLCLLVSFSFAVLLAILQIDLKSSLAVAIIIAIGISSAQTGLSFAFENRPLKLFLIYAAQSVVEFVTVVLILKLM
ncbi:MAG: DUF1761 domain-containing protein [Kordiimonadaceae bacterium]|nr:DUF1761 domain-containing protein [Kordiimonadaceae bacterium]